MRINFCSSRETIDLLYQMKNESIWEASYWAFRNKLMPCMTMNSPVEKLLKPNQVQVSFFTIMKTFPCTQISNSSIDLISILQRKKSWNFL